MRRSKKAKKVSVKIQTDYQNLEEFPALSTESNSGLSVDSSLTNEVNY